MARGGGGCFRLQSLSFGVAFVEPKAYHWFICGSQGLDGKAWDKAVIPVQFFNRELLIKLDARVYGYNHFEP